MVLLAGSETDADDEYLVECVGPHGVAAARPCPPDWPSMTRESKRSALPGSAGVVPACREAAGGLVGERVLGRVEVCRGEAPVPPVPGGKRSNRQYRNGNRLHEQAGKPWNKDAKKV